MLGGVRLIPFHATTDQSLGSRLRIRIHPAANTRQQRCA